MVLMTRHFTIVSDKLINSNNILNIEVLTPNEKTITDSLDFASPFYIRNANIFSKREKVSLWK